MPLLLPSEWDKFLSHFPDAHLLQTRAWGELKAEFGWEVLRVANGEAGAQILFRRLPLGYSLAYIPKGPVGEKWNALLPEIDQICREHRAVFLKVEPDEWEGIAQPGMETSSAPHLPPGFSLSPQSIQPQRTLLVDLQGSEEQILARMKQKTRYNIRLAQKKGVIVRPFSELNIFHRLMEVTAGRDAFDVHTLGYYQRAYELFHQRGACELLVAEYEGQPLAALMLFARGKRAWYFYGASANEHRERMPAYLLQWEAMRWARSQGCTVYDLWGVPDEDEQALEANFSGRNDGLWGVYRFKRGFGGKLCRSAGPWDRVYRPAIYALYRLWAGRRRGE